MSKPARWLAAVAGTGAGGLIPERMIQLDGKDLDILIYPMDLLISGKPELVARARAAMASRLTTSAAHLTVSAEAQAIEDRLTALAKARPDTPDRPAPFDDVAVAELAAIDEVLSAVEIPYEEWEVLYRQRLQVERDLRAGAMAGDAVLGAGSPAEAGAKATLTNVGRLVRSGAGAVLDAAADDKTVDALDKAAGPQWRWAVRLASVGVAAARSALGGDDQGAEPAARDPGADGAPARTDDERERAAAAATSRSAKAGSDADSAADTNAGSPRS